jgi:hypothetical protein
MQRRLRKTVHDEREQAASTAKHKQAAEQNA